MLNLSPQQLRVMMLISGGRELAILGDAAVPIGVESEMSVGNLSFDNRDAAIRGRGGQRVA